MEDLSIFFDKFYLFSFIIFLVSLGLYFITRKINLGIVDPLNFYWIFTFGTSYSVVILLYLEDYIDLSYALIILYFFLVFVFSLFLGMKIRFKYVKLKEVYVHSYKALLLVYLILLFYYFYSIDLSTFLYSRFEANKGGLGIISRIMDVLRLFIIAYISIDIYSTKNNKGYKFLLFIIFIGISSFANGSKYSILESVYVAAISICLFRGYTYKLNCKVAFVIFILSVIFLGYALFFTSKVAEALGYTSKYTMFPEAVEMFLLRIIANGDMYFLSLPNGIIDLILPDVSSFSELLFRPLLGSSLTQLVFSSHSETVSVGRAIWLYWYPDSLAGGSVEHFDLMSYRVGYFGGTLLTFFIGFFIGRINTMKFSIMKKKNKNILNIVFFSFIYNKAYLLLLSPTTGVSILIDGFLVFILCYLIGLLNINEKRHYS